MLRKILYCISFLLITGILPVYLIAQQDEEIDVTGIENQILENSTIQPLIYAEKPKEYLFFVNPDSPVPDILPTEAITPAQGEESIQAGFRVKFITVNGNEVPLTIAYYDNKGNPLQMVSEIIFPKRYDANGGIPLNSEYAENWVEACHFIYYEYDAVTGLLRKKILRNFEMQPLAEYRYSYDDNNRLMTVEKYGKSEFLDKLILFKYVKFVYQDEASNQVRGYTLFNEEGHAIFSWYFTVENQPPDTSLYVRYKPFNEGFAFYAFVRPSQQAPEQDEELTVYNSDYTQLRTGALPVNSSSQ